MSTRKRFYERDIVIPHAGGVLEGRWHRGEDNTPVVIGAPHPHLGGNMDHPVVAELAFAAGVTGSPTLRFNYRGVGGSPGTAAGGARDVEDYRAALAHLLETTGAAPACAAGYSFGAWAAVQAAADPRIERLILVAPATRSLDHSALRALKKPILLLYGTADDALDPDDLATLSRDQPAARVEAIEGADHFFSQGLGTLSRLVSEAMAPEAASES